MAKPQTHNQFSDLGYKIFLDRYAQKDMQRSTLAVGDIVIVVVDPKTGQREIGRITGIQGTNYTIELLDGEFVTRDIANVDKPIETDPSQMMDRVAKGVASVEKDEKSRKKWENEFRWLLEDFKFVPAGRILAAAGTDQALTYYNCYVIPSPEDSRGGILKTLHQMTEIMSRGGGVGINLSSLRPKQAFVKGVNGRSSGSVSWGALYSFVTGLIEQGGSRRGALMLILNDWHPDVLDFINSKREAGKITNANISVGVSDFLMEAVKNDADWKFFFPDTSDEMYDTEWHGDFADWTAKGGAVIEYGKMKARDLWDAIIQSAWASAEPGIWFNQRSNNMSNSWYFSPLIATNPCGEQPLAGWSVCNLGALNLAKFYDAETNSVEWGELDKAVAVAVRFLDNVIDTTPYFFDENENQQKRERRVGLNNMGLAELLLKLGIRYGSDKSIGFIDKLYRRIAEVAYMTSCYIAQEKGAFPEFDAEKFLQSGFMRNMPDSVRYDVMKNGIRNVTLLTQAPNGTTGTMVNTSTGIEPFFSWKYFRKSRLGLHEEEVPIVAEYFKAHPEATELPDYFVTAMDLSPEEHVKVQGAVQRWVDSAISKTCNVPESYTVEQTKALYELMYELGCKGGTIYRDNSRSEQVLMLKVGEKAPEPIASANINANPFKIFDRPRILSGSTLKAMTPFGNAYVTMNSDEQGQPFEVFITAPGKAGSDLQADAEALGRMISLQLRSVQPENRMEILSHITEQLQGIGGSRTAGMGANRVMSLPDAVAIAIKKQYFSNVTVGVEAEPAQPVAEVRGYSSRADMCPSCSTVSLIRADGCRKCLTCGYSEC